MSKIDVKRNVQRISALPPEPEFLPSLVHLSELSTGTPLGFNPDELASYCPSDIATALKDMNASVKPSETAFIASPGAIRSSFAAAYVSAINQSTGKGLTKLSAKKAAVLASLSAVNARVTNQKLMSASIKAIVKCRDEQTLNSEMNSIWSKVETEHKEVFTHILGRAVVSASAKTGFKEVNVKVLKGKVEIIARNHEGQHLVSEISIDKKSGQAHLSTETIGIVDGSCNNIMERFNAELDKMDIKAGGKEVHYTGNNCRLPLSKIVEQEEKNRQRKAKELNRVKKLNPNIRHKH